MRAATFRIVSALAAAVALAACAAEPRSADSPTPTPTPSPSPTPSPTPSPSPAPTPTPSPRAYEPLPVDLTLDRELVAEGLGQVVDIALAPGDSRLYVVEKEGVVWVVDDGTVREEPFLDLRDDVRAGGLRSEQGLLALAFHPAYMLNGRLFVYYVTSGDDDTRLEEITVTPDRERADLRSRRTLLEVHQPFRWHNGGTIAFGRDGVLWLSLGDGGVSGDPDLHAQDPSSLLGAILRVDVDGGEPYAIPPDNPFADGGDAAPEVWAYGLRNPWRMHLDHTEGLAYIADVGQHAHEWVNVVPDDEGGHNFGWPVVEGEVCFPEHADRCPGEGLTDPVLVYGHGDDGACAIIGGVVHDGTEIPALNGHYFYTDFCGGWLRSFRYHDGDLLDERDWTGQVGRFELPTTVALDGDGEVLVADSSGSVWRLTIAN